MSDIEKGAVPLTEEYSDLIRFPSSQPRMSEFKNLDYINNALTINTWYTPLDTTKNVKAHYIIVEQTNNGATNEDIVCELTIDGTIYTWTRGAVSARPYYLFFTAAGAVTDTDSKRQVLSFDNDQSAPLETRSLQIRVRQTSGVDVVSAQIEVNMVYATLEVS